MLSVCSKTSVAFFHYNHHKLHLHIDILGNDSTKEGNRTTVAIITKGVNKGVTWRETYPQSYFFNNRVKLDFSPALFETGSISSIWSNWNNEANCSYYNCKRLSQIINYKYVPTQLVQFSFPSLVSPPSPFLRTNHLMFKKVWGCSVASIFKKEGI